MKTLAVTISDETLAYWRERGAQRGQSPEEVAAMWLEEAAARDRDGPGYELSDEQMALVREALEDPRPGIPHEVVMAEMRAMIAGRGG